MRTNLLKIEEEKVVLKALRAAVDNFMAAVRTTVATLRQEK